MAVLAEIKAYRVKGGAIVRVIRRGRTHRYRVSHRRYAWLRDWCITRIPWRCGGAWMKSSLCVTVSDELNPYHAKRRAARSSSNA